MVNPVHFCKTGIFRFFQLPGRIVFGLIIAILFIIPISSLGCNTSYQKYEEPRDMWSTFVTVPVYSPDKALAEEAITAAFDRITEIGDTCSIYDENSQAFILNRNGYLDNASPDLLELVKSSIKYNLLTDGAFNIAVQPLLDLWSAGLWQESPEVQQERINKTLEITKADDIEVTGSRIAFKAEGMKITLGGITKGYAADEALKVIQEKGIDKAMVSAGGDITTIGSKPGGEPWQIALVNPDNPQDSLAVFNFAGYAIATSGNYERYFSPDKKVSHILNPKTGYTVSDCISVTVIGKSGLLTDVLATSIFVMGPEAGINFVESLHNVEAFIVDSNREIHLSSGISKYMSTAG